VEGEWVMPFLHGLKAHSMFYALQAIHRTGSSDADFALLTASMPNGKIAPFRVEGYPYDDTLPELARQRGYCCVAMHGNTGSFFNRRPAYEKMGFSEVYFAEELHRMGCEIPYGGVLDEDVLRLSAQWMQQARQPTIHFIITLTSHGPFNRVPAEKRELFPQPAGESEAYLNCMRYVDRALEAYVAALPEGTVVVLYGDHDSGVQGYREASLGSGGRVPGLIYRKGDDLSQRQWTRETDLARCGPLTQLDLASYVHGSLRARTCAPDRGSGAVAETARGEEPRREVGDRRTPLRR